MAIRILIVDDHPIFTRALKALLELRSDLEVVGEAADGRKAVILAGTLHPDVVLLDLAMPNLNGVDAARELLKQLPATRVIVLSAHLDRRHLMEARAAGASGYVPKDAATEELFHAIDAAMRGEKFISETIRHRTGIDSNGNGHSAEPSLSPRERQILQLLAEGRATKEAAREMGVSVKTAETYRHSIMDKLHLYSVAELTKHAIREGITTVDF